MEAVHSPATLQENTPRRGARAKRGLGFEQETNFAWVVAMPTTMLALTLLCVWIATMGR